MKKYVLKIEEENCVGIPADIMDKMKLKSGDEIDVTCSVHGLIIEKCGSECLICGETANLREMGNGKFMCPKCLEALKISVEKL